MQEPTYDSTRPMPAIELVSQYKLNVSGINGKTVCALRVVFPPNGSTPPHRHGGCAVSAFVISGTLLNKMNDSPMKVIESGGTWYEAPGCHHRISDNASKTEEAVLLATMIVDTEAFERDGMGALIQIDEEYR
ncbi:RmlC-like cupin domain-containing protein [Penicillium manginii]|uniref:RmlC-like cupin domain-containing protein n=1 Tax=Penicillium manginii TaxID=203109 RepID=UPI002546C204|nr:RmlC-like cupin domain-containing protein [Penicillium manginii]KAJ5763386.1 RmlC-like cupin domain-containing protein [Penicillium manginii]